MSKVIVKQRFFWPNRKKTPISNREHIRYIATRTGVIYNVGMTHGLFGKAFGMAQYGMIEDIKDFQQKILDLSKAKTIVYRCIVSLNEEDAIKKGFDRRSEWELAVTAQLGKIAEVMRIPIDKLEWCAATHMDKGHPHTHLIYWERDQGIRKAWIDPQQSNTIRGSFLKSIFADEFANLYREKNRARDALELESIEFLTDSIPYGMDRQEFNRLVDEMKATDSDLATGRLPYNKIPLAFCSGIFASLVRLKGMLPPKGRLVYGYLPPETKTALLGLVRDLVSKAPQLKQEFLRYTYTAAEIAELHTSNQKTIDAAQNKATAEMEKKLANQVLAFLKDLPLENSHTSQPQHTIQGLLQSLFFMLTQGSDQMDAQGRQPQNGSLSKQALIELAKQHSQGFER